MESRGRGGASLRAPARQTLAQELKVKHIITRKVCADEASFKDVVLRLTGKDSAAARAELLGACDDNSSKARTTALPMVAAGGSNTNSSNVRVEGSGDAGFNMGTAVSFQDTVMPSLEEMNRWWGLREY